MPDRSLSSETRPDPLTSGPSESAPRFPKQRLEVHVKRLYPRSEPAVREAALEALERRHAFSQRDELRIAETPKDSFYGRYILRRKGRRERPYDTMLRSLEPLAGTCDCADFRRASLGLCKHLLVVLDHLARGPRILKDALAEEAPVAYRAVLTCDSIRPLHGEGDFFERIRLHPPQRGMSTPAYKSLTRLFAKAVRSGSVLRSTHADNPKKRLQTTDALLAFLKLQNLDERFCEPALAARLREERDRLLLARELIESKTKHLQALRSLETKLYPYQQETVHRFLQSGRMLIADDMGLGKTAQAVACAHALFLAGSIRRGLLVVPAALKPQWLREWAAFSSAPITLVEGSAKERAALYRKTKAGFLVANYEQVLRDLAVMKRWEPDLVVLDEAQRIKNWASKTSHQVKELQPAYRLVLTGTPMENRLEELASLFDWVEDHALEPKWRLSPFHTYSGTRPGFRNRDALRERLRPHWVRRERSEVLRQLPPRTDSQISVPMTSQQAAQHDELDRPINALLHRAGKRSLRPPEFARLLQLLNTQRIAANGLAQLDYASLWLSLKERKPSERALQGLFSPKLIELREWIQQIAVQQARKVVVFSQWHRMLNLAHWAVSDLLHQEELEARFFTGTEGHKRRAENLADFHKDPRARVLFVSDAGGAGLNLQAAANALIHLELPWNPAVLEQRVSRIHRIGQKGPVDIYHLVSTGSIEEKLSRALLSEDDSLEGLFDAETEAVHPDGQASFVRWVRKLRGAKPKQVMPEAEIEEAEDPELEALLTAADESTDTSVPSPDELSASEVQALFSQLVVEKTESGGLRFEAPPESAETLAALFQGMAKLLRESK